uniref:C-type lectin domain-containing protein n=1 Tax=Denticeps clupeoides TaxID=299321 RepID=A0AAY3ZWT3_9TELE
MPSTSVTPQNCVATKLNYDGQWANRDCNETYPFICSQDQLVLVHQNMTWREARVFCRESYVDLVAIDSADAQGRVAELLKSASGAYVWTGLRYSCALDVWYWMGGEAVCYQNWAGVKKDQCGQVGAVQTGGLQRWVSLPETETHNFVCTAFQGEVENDPPGRTGVCNVLQMPSLMRPFFFPQIKSHVAPISLHSHLFNPVPFTWLRYMLHL